MSSRGIYSVDYPQVRGYGEATNETGMVDIIANPGTTLYLYLDQGVISVYKPAAGGGGITRLQDTDGNIVLTVSADNVSVVPLNWGDEGLRLGPNVGLQLIVAGGATAQASVSVALTGHLAFR